MLDNSVVKLYHKALKNKDFFFIFFYLAGGRGDEWIELYLPVPNVIIYPKGKNGVFIGYFIEGFFGTEKNRKFLKDIIKRFEKTFLKLSHIGYIERIKHPPILDNKADFRLQFDVIYSLKDFSRILDSLDYQVSKKEEQIENLKIAKALGERKITDDALFDYMRFIAYDFVNTNGKKALTKEYLEKIGELGNEILGKTKEFSTIKAKAKAIYKWVIKNYSGGQNVNNWNYIRKTKNDKEWKELKMKALLKYKEQQKKTTKEKIKKVAIELKSKNIKPTILKIKDLTNLSKNTVAKYLKELKEEGTI